MSCQQEKISIIVPVYNGQRFLPECVNSILAQDYQNIEVFLVNDGSKDNSGALIDEFARKDSRVIALHQENAGVSAARNNALRRATGAYVCLIDQDDCVATDYVSYFYRLIKENRAEIALTPQARRFVSTEGLTEDKTQDSVEVWSGEQAAAAILYYKFIIAPWNKMISMDLIRKNNLEFCTKFFGGEGFSFSVDCFQRAQRVAVGHKKVYYYRVDNPESGTTKFSLFVINSNINAQKFIRSRLVKETPSLVDACRYANWHTHCDCINTIIGCGVKQKHEDLYKQIKSVCQKEAVCAFKAPVSMKEKMKAFMYLLSPYCAARIINHFRVRKFTKEDN